MVRILVAELFHESNGLVHSITPSSAFTIRTGEGLLRNRGDGTLVGSIVEAIEARGWQVVPAIGARAQPSGPVATALTSLVTSHLLEVVAAAGALDGIALSLHGAMVGEARDDPEGDLVGCLRQLPGMDATPIVAGFDLHGNPSAALVDRLNGMCVYRRNPHDDIAATGRRLVALLERLRGAGERGACVRASPGVCWEPSATATVDEPMASLEAGARGYEQRHAWVEEIGVFAGFPYARHDRAGVSICVSTLAPHRAAATAVAEALAQQVRSASVPVSSRCSTLEEVDALIASAPAGPLVLAEPSDNIGAGTRGDATGGIRLLLERWGGIASLATCCDPQAVAAAVDVPIHGRLNSAIGGRDQTAGVAPLVERWTLLHRSNGTFRLADPAGPLSALYGQTVAMGPTLVLQSQALRLLVTSTPTPPWDLAQWTCVGIDPRQARLILVKSAVAHRRAYGPIAAGLVSIDTPGPCRLRR